LKDLESKNNKLLQALRNAGCDRIAEAYQWVQDNKKQFRKEVYGPVLLEVCLAPYLFIVLFLAHETPITIHSFLFSQVNVQDRSHATYLENHVSNYIWKVKIR
jgi:structural maintenance of chromosomes protein 5